MRKCSRRSQAELADEWQSEMKQMTQFETEAIIALIVADTLVVDVEVVTSNTRLVEDLGADSLNFLEIALDINHVLDIELPPEGLACLRTVEDLHRLVHQAIAQASF